MRGNPPGQPPGPRLTWSGRRFAVYRGNDLMGTTLLEYVFQPGERLGGEFHPTRYYYEIERTFLRLSYALSRSLPSAPDILRERDNLLLELWMSGERLDAVVELISQWEPRRWMIHVATRDPRLWNDFRQA